MNASSFWNTNLDEIEASFLPKGKKITDLPTTLDSRVPSQGSVLLNNTVNIDEIVSDPSILKQVFYRLFH